MHLREGAGMVGFPRQNAATRRRPRSGDMRPTGGAPAGSAVVQAPPWPADSRCPLRGRVAHAYPQASDLIRSSTGVEQHTSEASRPAGVTTGGSDRMIDASFPSRQCPQTPCLDIS